MAGMECMGLKMIDHVIVATGGNFSFLDAGLL
jgi:DNA repair protein RadC